MKLFFEKYISNFIISGFKVKSILILLFTRIIFISIGLVIYNSIDYLLSGVYSNKLMIAEIAAIIISIIFFLPIQEYVEIYLKKKILSEYLFDDPLTLRFAHKRFEVYDLIRNVFPDMVRASGSNMGRLAILNQLSYFEAYTFTKGRRRKIKNQSFLVNKRLMIYLVSKKDGVSISETLDRPDINEDFALLKATFILPFIFREKLFGFLALTDVPDEQSLKTMRIISSKSAISIYNHILSSQIAIHKKYKHEFEVASRIEDQIFSIKVPEFSGIEFKSFQKDPNLLLEFFKNDEEGHVFALIALSGKNRFSSGLVSSHLLGKYYSQSLIRKKHNHKTIRVYTEKCLNDLMWNEGFEMIIGSFKENSTRITFTQVGLNFRITDSDEKLDNLISVGWKYTLDIKSENLFIYYKREKILSISKKLDDSETVIVKQKKEEIK
jgi:hypothetical protein